MAKPSSGRPLKFKSVKELEKKIEQYFKSCDKHTSPYVMKSGKRRRVIQIPDPKPYTITGLALFLGTTRQTLLEYQGEVEGREKKDAGFADAIRKAKLRCENYAEESLWRPKIATGVVFNLVNNYGWKDKKEIDVTEKKKLVKLDE